MVCTATDLYRRGFHTLVPIRVPGWEQCSSRGRNERFFCKIKEDKAFRGGVLWYAAQGNPLADAEIAKKRRFWTGTRYDEHAISQIQRNIELIRYRYFQSDLLLLEMVNSVIPATGSASGRTPTTKGEYKTITDTLETLSGELRDLYDDLGDFNRGLGDDVQEKVLKYYVAFKRIRNFCCVEVHPQKKALTLFLHLDPDETELVPDFTRDVRKIGHYGTGDLEVTVRNQDDLERTKELIRRSFERS